MKKNTGAKYSDKLLPFLEAVGALSKIQRLIIVIATFSIMIGAFVLLSYMPKMEEIQATNDKYEKANKALKVAKAKAAQLAGLQEQWDKKQEEFKLVLAALPDKKEIPTLVSEISKAGKSAGLDFYRFAPRVEIARDFYAEIPVSINLKGSFVGISEFFKNISDLSRIVNIKNINLSPVANENAISLDCAAITYRFLTPTPTK